MNALPPGRLGPSGAIARYFLESRLTPLLALVALLLGVFAVAVTPREEEPQINVTMANVLIPFPGASVRDVEQMVAGPAEQVLGQMAGLEHVMSVSRPGLAVITVQFKVGVPRTEALVRLHDTLDDNRDWLPAGLGVGEPIVKPKGIDDVPILAVTLYDQRPDGSAFALERIAHALEAELKRVRGTRDVQTIGGPGRAINIDVDVAALRAADVTLPELAQALRSANGGLPAGEVVAGNAALRIDAGEWFRDAADVGGLIVAVGTAAFGWRLFAPGVASAQVVKRALMAGEALKWLWLVLAVWLALTKLRLAPLPLLAGLMAAQFGYWFGLVGRREG